MMDYHLDADEARELRAALDDDEWEALLTVQRELTSAPLLGPSSRFVDGVMTRIAVRERAEVGLRNLLGALLFALGSATVAIVLVWLSPLGGLARFDGWTAILSGAFSFAADLLALFVAARALVQAVLDVTGDWLLLILAFVAFALTLVWVSVVVSLAPLNRPSRATEAIQ